jgi:hypothetical protein
MRYRGLFAGQISQPFDRLQMHADAVSTLLRLLSLLLLQLEVLREWGAVIVCYGEGGGAKSC